MALPTLEELRCPCGKLVARRVGDHWEVLCHHCKRQHNLRPHLTEHHTQGRLSQTKEERTG